MAEALVVLVVLVLVVEVLHYRRSDGLPGRVAKIIADTQARAAKEQARMESDVFKEALARRLNLTLRGIQGYHDQIAEDFRIQVAASELRARLAEGKRDDATGVATGLRALAREMSGIAAELRALQGDLVGLVCAAIEARPAPPAAAQIAPKVMPALEDPDDRKTAEMTPPASCVPPAGAPRAAAANDSADDEGWDDPEEKTKLFSKDGAQAAVVVALRQRAGAPSAPAPRHALRPPPPQMADEEDDAPERPSILPEARTSGGAS